MKAERLQALEDACRVTCGLCYIGQPVLRRKRKRWKWAEWHHVGGRCYAARIQEMIYEAEKKETKNEYDDSSNNQPGGEPGTVNA